MSVINSKQDSDRLIRELMTKNKDLEARCNKFTEVEREQAASAQQAQQALVESQNENRELTKMLSKARIELDDQVILAFVLFIISWNYLFGLAASAVACMSPEQNFLQSLCQVVMCLPPHLLVCKSSLE
jgi:cell shape-determining protein MreC